jgi:formate dehydrogenase subunit gamma
MDDRNGTPQLSPGDLDTVRDLLSQAPATTPDALIPLLHAVQHRLGHVPPEAIRLLADALNLSRAEVHGVASFYHDFHLAPTPGHMVQLCMAEACQAVGCRELAAHAQATLGVGFDEATPDGRTQLKRVYCLGNCAAGPAVRIGDRVHGRVTAARLDALLEGTR